MEKDWRHCLVDRGLYGPWGNSGPEEDCCSRLDESSNGKLVPIVAELMFVEWQSKRALIFGIPPPNPSFTGRSEILTTIHRRLVVTAKPGLTASFALHGLGGVGKTQIAIQYAYLHKTHFDIICWLRANDWDTLVSSYVELSRDPDLTAVGAPPFEDGLENASIAKRMIMWFNRETTLKWLLIFDNADKIDARHETHSLVELIPRGECGCVLATSRNRASDGELASAGCEVEVMNQGDAVDFLLLCSRHDEGQRNEAETLVRVLGYLPLAIEQAGCYIRTTGMSISRYIMHYEMNKPKALKHGLPLSHEVYYKNTVATTWKISFDEVDTRDPLASEILRLMAFLDGTRIQMELFETGGKSLTAGWRVSNATMSSIEDSLGCLQSFSLVRRLTGDDISIHVLVQQVMKEHIGVSRHFFNTTVLSLVGSQFSWGGDLQNFSVCLKYMSQAKICIEKYPELETYSNELVQLAGSLASFFYSNGEYETARTEYERALRIYEKAFRVNHIKTASTINNLGITYRSQGKYDEAISQYERALRIYEKAFGVDHINSADTINNLGSTYDSQGKYDEAISQYERTLRIKEKAFGVDHINTASTIMGLGSTYHSQGRYDEAISQYERALRIYEKAFGVDHINSADTINNLGGTYDSQGKYDEAISQYERALRIYEKAFGVNHINSADTINNLGNTYHSQGKYDEAISQYERALRIYEKAFGVDHINMANTINNLGNTYHRQGKYDEAISQYKRALRIYEKAFGVDHINTADTINNLGNTYDSQGKYDEAISQYERALRIYEKAFGVDHINTADTINNLGNTYDSQGKYDEAISQYERALRIKEKAFGVDHINTAGTIMNIGSTYYRQGKYDEAISQYERALRIYEKAFGVDHINTADTINNLGSTYGSQGKYYEAISQYERALRIYEKAFGVDHINTANTIIEY